MAGKKGGKKQNKRKRRMRSTYPLPNNYGAIQQKLENMIENAENTKNGKGWKLGLGGRKRSAVS